MHYRNGREAKNGDEIVKLSTAAPLKIEGVGVLFGAKPGSNYCNGQIAPTNGGPVTYACLCDCLHIDDVGEIMKEKGLDKRPAGM